MNDTEHPDGDSAVPSKPPFNPEDPPGEALVYALVFVILAWLALMVVLGNHFAPEIHHWLHVHNLG